MIKRQAYRTCLISGQPKGLVGQRPNVRNDIAGNFGICRLLHPSCYPSFAGKFAKIVSSKSGASIYRRLAGIVGWMLETANLLCYE